MSEPVARKIRCRKCNGLIEGVCETGDLACGAAPNVAAGIPMTFCRGMEHFVQRVEDFLRIIEYAGDGDARTHCPACRTSIGLTPPHSPGCALAALLEECKP